MKVKDRDFIFIPEYFDYSKADSLGLNDESFLKLQIKYKELFEKLIISNLDFSEIENELKKNKYPIVEDKGYNFYHKYSVLGSDYIYFRNNIHIENLTADEIQKLTNEDVEIDFLKNTYERVLYEDGDITFLGEPSNETKILSHSIMLELAIDYAKLEDINYALLIEKIIAKLKLKAAKEYQLTISKLLDNPNLVIDVHFYDAMPDYFANQVNDYAVEENFPPDAVLNSNIDVELGEKLYNEYVEKEVTPDGEVYETVYYDEYWNIVPKEKAVTSARNKIK